MNKKKWVSNSDHSEFLFTVKPLMLANITGYIRTFTLELDMVNGELVSASGFKFRAKAASIDTHDSIRDRLLKSPEFLFADAHQHIEFLGRSMEKEGAVCHLYGNLTIKGITKSTVLQVSFSEWEVDSEGKGQVCLIVDGEISRKTFGLRQNTMTPEGELIFGDSVQIHGEFQLVECLCQTESVGSKCYLC